MSQAASMRYAAKLARKSPSEAATRCAVPATSLAMSSVFGTWDSPHPPATIVTTNRTPVHRAYCCAVPAFIAHLVMPMGRSPPADGSSTERESLRKENAETHETGTLPHLWSKDAARLPLPAHISAS